MGKNLKGKELGAGIYQRKDGRYSARFVTFTGKRIEKYFPMLQEARKWLAEAKLNDENGAAGVSMGMSVLARLRQSMDIVIFLLQQRIERYFLN